MRGLLILGLAMWADPACAEVRSLPVLTVTVYPGDAIPDASLRDKKFTGTASVFAGYVQEGSEVAGKFARRTIVAGLPIPRTAIKEREVVFQGAPTLATLRFGGLTITTTLLPLESGAAGQRIRTRNPDSGLTVMATAQGDGTLTVGDQ